MKLVEALFLCVRSSLNGNKLNDEEKFLMTDELLLDVLKMAKQHDIEHLVALGILNNELANEKNKPQLQQVVFRAVYRYEQLNYDFKNVCEALENAKIPFLPLKGSVLRSYYPEPWMRTSCDIDILVPEKYLDVATLCLVENLKYTKHRKYSHDVSLFSSNGVHLELHYDLVEDGWANSSSKILKNVWDYASVKNGKTYWYELSDSIFYFYHIAHMAKHFQQGGCGIRPFIDLWILERLAETNEAERDDLLNKGELLQFARTARKITNVWINGESMDSVSQKMENFIINGGVYGNISNRIAVQQQKKGGSIKYVFSKIVIPYDELKFHYPVLQKHRWLLPIMQVRRWFKLVFCGHAKRSMRELSYNKNISESQADEIKVFLDEVGL